MKKLLFIFSVFFLVHCASEDSNLDLPSESLSGSYANLLAIGDYLYFITETDIVTYDLTNPANPTEINRNTFGFSLESLLYHKGFLFVGSSDNMFIFTVGADGVPVLSSTTPYTTQNGINGFNIVDPIAVNDTFAFVTLSTSDDGIGNSDGVNELRVFDITEFTDPLRVNTLPLDEPKGVGIDGDLLFICLRNDGLVVLDISDPLNITELHHFDGYEAFDVIVDNGLLLVVGPTELREYDYSDIDGMNLLSIINL